MKNLGNQTGATDVSITKRMQEMEKRISGIDEMIEEIGSLDKDNFKSKKKC